MAFVTWAEGLREQFFWEMMISSSACRANQLARDIDDLMPHRCAPAFATHALLGANIRPYEAVNGRGMRTAVGAFGDWFGISSTCTPIRRRLHCLE